ncbi:hypothetical protein LSPH26S_03811 [Lysinibacillus sphaericus]
MGYKCVAVHATCAIAASRRRRRVIRASGLDKQEIDGMTQRTALVTGQLVTAAPSCAIWRNRVTRSPPTIATRPRPKPGARRWRRKASRCARYAATYPTPNPAEASAVTARDQGQQQCRDHQRAADEMQPTARLSIARLQRIELGKIAKG